MNCDVIKRVMSLGYGMVSLHNIDLFDFKKLTSKNIDQKAYPKGLHFTKVSKKLEKMVL